MFVAILNQYRNVYNKFGNMLDTQKGETLYKTLDKTDQKTSYILLLPAVN